MRAPSLIAAVCLAAATSSLAADAPPAPLPSTADVAVGKTCTAPVYRQFDFWLGRWTVTDPQGNVVGHSRITRISQGCAIHERWLGRRSTGHSLNYYDPAKRQWRQDWVGSNGQVLHLRGGRRSESMVLAGTRRDTRGPVLDRITWTPLAHHRVRQHWQVSRDDGRTWRTLFLGTYTPQAAGAGPADAR